MLEEVEDIDITTINKLVSAPTTPALETAPSIAPPPVVPDEAVPSQTAPSKKKKKSMKELEALKKQIETSLSSLHDDEDDE